MILLTPDSLISGPFSLLLPSVNSVQILLVCAYFAIPDRKWNPFGGKLSTCSSGYAGTHLRLCRSRCQVSTLLTLIISILVALNVISFIAQFRRIYQTKSSENISVIFLSFSIFSATEQANVSKFHAMMYGRDGQPDFFAELSTEWRHLSQVSMLWMVLSIIL
jgi:hypothetical protein